MPLNEVTREEQIYKVANPDWNPWENDTKTFELYHRRCRQEADEMTCAAQCAHILAGLAKPNETLLDAGCGGGYYYWSFYNRNIPVEYYGLDYTPRMIELAIEEMCPGTGIPPDRFMLGAIEYLDMEFDNTICFNVLTNNPHYALSLERLLRYTRKRIIIRESMGDELIVRYTPDPYLDEGKRHIRVYHNMYPIREVTEFMKENGFRVTRIEDERSQDGLEMVCDIPHQWRILLGERIL